MKIPIKNLLMLLISSIFLLSCTTKTLSIDVIDTDPLIVYSNSEIYDTLYKADWSSAKKISETTLKSLPVFKLNKSLENYRPNRAFAVAFPEECGSSWHSWNFGSEKRAASAALAGCLKSNQGMEKHVPTDRCGARLVLVNNKLLVRQESLPDHFYSPVIVEQIFPDGQVATWYGVFQDKGTGSDLPMELQNERGERICIGKYSSSYLNAFLGSGDFTLECFGRTTKISGDFSLKRIKLKHMQGYKFVGIGKGQTEDNQRFRFITGINIDNFETYKNLILK